MKLAGYSVRIPALTFLTQRNACVYLLSSFKPPFKGSQQFEVSTFPNMLLGANRLVRFRYQEARSSTILEFSF